MVSESDHNIAPSVTEEEATLSPPSPSHRNAFKVLMSSQIGKAPPPQQTHTRNRLFDRRSGLGAYIVAPEKYDASTVIDYNQAAVAIHDLFPKSSMHCLLLPRNEDFQLIHPFDAFENPKFLETIRFEAAKLKTLVAKELRRKYGKFSKQDAAREAIFNGEIELPEGEALPEGRNWEAEVKVGIHAHPSMNHLHIHVISRDHYSDFLKHSKHYNSFNTPFFVDLEAFPLNEHDDRRHPGREGYLKSDLKCWRCGQNFGNKFARLKEHLAVEFEEWKSE